MIRLQCPKCWEWLEVADSKAGRRIYCSKCDARIRVPEAEDEDEDEDEERPQRKPKKRRRRQADDSGPRLTARNAIMGSLFILLGSMMVCGGLTADRVGYLITGLTLGPSLIATGVIYYFLRRE